jgi:hypothetical protein
MWSTWYAFPSCWIANSIREVGSSGSRYRIKYSLVRNSWRVQVAPSRTRELCPPLYRPPCPQTEGDQDTPLRGITTKRVLEAMTHRPQAGVGCVGEGSPIEAGGAISLELAGLTQQALAHVITDEASVPNSHVPSKFFLGTYGLTRQACT